MFYWYSHVFSVENKTSTCFRGNNIEILLKCVLPLNKITSSQGLTFFFEIWGFNQGPWLLWWEQRVGSFSRSWACCFVAKAFLGISSFSPAKTLHDCPGLKVKPTTGCKEKSLDTSLKICSDWLWSESVGKGMVGVSADHHLIPPCDHVHLPLSAIPFFF